jgi:pimeloyl-ACP methyl ester carboxylesterase
MHAIATPWGFELEAITVPVRLLQGTDDLMVAPAHAEWLRDRIPGATLELLPGQGHILQRFYGELFDWLTLEG